MNGFATEAGEPGLPTVLEDRLALRLRCDPSCCVVLRAVSAVQLLEFLIQTGGGPSDSRLRPLAELDPAWAAWCALEFPLAASGGAGARRIGVSTPDDDTQMRTRLAAAWCRVRLSSRQAAQWQRQDLQCVATARLAAELARRDQPGNSTDARTLQLALLARSHCLRLGPEDEVIGLSTVDQVLAGWPSIRDDSNSSQSTPEVARWVQDAVRMTEDDPEAVTNRWVSPAEREAWTTVFPPLHGWSLQLIPWWQEWNELRGQFERKLEAEKLAALKELAYGASHEINNPLANISSRAQVMLRDETDPERRRSLATINSQAFRAHEMIADMMLFAKPPALERRAVDPAELVRQVAEQCRSEMASGIQLHLEVSDDLGWVAADSVQLAVALRAIVVNALQAIGSVGRLRIAVTRSGSPLGDGPRQVSIQVEDSGPGLSPDVRRHLFDPFFSGREAGRGLGFGLSKAWRIVQLHDGQIEVDSQIGQGTTFTVILPSSE